MVWLLTKMLPANHYLEQLVKRVKVTDETGKRLTDKKLEDIIEFKINCEENETHVKNVSRFQSKYLPNTYFYER